MSSANDYLALPFQKFLDDTAARTPSPGGGSVSASVGALAAALARMAIEYTAGNKKYVAHEERLQQLREELRRAQEMFGQLMREDMAAYERYAAARKSGDAQELERAIATAVAVPMEIVVLAGAVTARLDEIKAFTNPRLYGDLQAAAVLAHSAAMAAATSVRSNLHELANPKEATRLEDKLDLLLTRSGRHRNAVLHHEPAAVP
ncbi:MAG: hypothetical protein AMXMBFR13_34780 [Phycisphaerae bacterium]|jgi:formiminotetrahydrofolate cyclodeaminase